MLERQRYESAKNCKNSALQGGFSVEISTVFFYHRNCPYNAVKLVQSLVSDSNALEIVPNSYGQGTSKCNVMSFLPNSSCSYIFMEHRLNTQHSVAQFIVDFSVVLQEYVHQLLFI